MPYADSTSLIAPYLRPMYPAAIQGIQDAQTQGRWEQVQDEEKRRWEANRPFVDAQAKQMQFAANKAEEAWNLYNSVNGGQGDGKLAAAGIDPKEYMRAYLGIQAKNPKIKVDIPGVGPSEVEAGDYLNYLTKQKEAMPNVYVPSARMNLPANVAHYYPDFQKPDKGPAPQLIYRVGPDGKPYAQFVTPTPGMQINDVYKPQSERGGYTQGQMVDDNLSYYGFKSKSLLDPMTGRVVKGKESEYQQLLSEYQNDLLKISQGQKPTWAGGTSREQDKDDAFLDQIRQALGGGQPEGAPSIGGGHPISNPQFSVNPRIDPNRPAINNSDGSFSTERTITIEMNGKYYLLPTIVNGQQLTPDQAVMAAMAGKNNPVGEFNSQMEADIAARLRSNMIPNARGMGPR
jgi:hypothetical protein